MAAPGGAARRARPRGVTAPGPPRTSPAWPGDRRGGGGDPAYSGVAGMRDLAAELVATVHAVQAGAGDETGS